MRKHHSETQYLSVLTVVVSRLTALVEIMRCNHCCPYSAQDATRIILLSSGQQGWPSDNPTIDLVRERTIRLLRFSASTEGVDVRHWWSLGVRILDERSPDDAQLTDGDALQLAVSP